MSKKKKGLLKLFAIFFVIELVLSFFLTSTIVIGKDSETGKFGLKIEKEESSLQEEIIADTQPDTFFRESEVMHAKVKHGSGKQLTNAEIIKLYQEENDEEALHEIAEFLPYKSIGLYLTFHKIFGDASTINSFKLLRMLLIVDIIFIVLAIMIRKGVNFYPGKLQIMGESFYAGAEGMVKDTLGKENIHFTPYLLTLFLFIWFSNLIGIIPIPGFIEPTRNLNVPLGMGIAALSVVHFMSIKKKGLWAYMKEYGEPMFFLAPLNIVGELSKVVSISFRLFGNIMGGGIIILVVSALTKLIIVPIGLYGFFGIFAGTIQAFVFAMLAMSYLAVAIAEE